MPELSEEQLAEKRNLYQQTIFHRTRRRSVAITVVAGMAAVLSCILGLEVVFVIALSVMIIAALLYFDANGHLHELRRRSNVLAPDFSLLDGNDGEPRQQSAAPQNPSPQR